MEIIPESMPATAPAPQYLPRFADGTVNLQELIRSMAEMLANEIMSADHVGNVGVRTAAH